MFLLQRSISTKVPSILKSIHICPRQYQFQALARHTRWSSTAVNAAKFASKKTLYPERLLIYHAGTGRTVFAGCLKITTIFIFSAFALFVAPTHFYSDAEPIWVAPAVLLSGTIPMVVVAYLTNPFVTYVHLRIPVFARNSREMLLRCAKSLPKDASVEITTMNFIGKPRVFQVKIADLHPVKKRLGMANYARDSKIQSWWARKGPSQFAIHGGTSKIKGGEIWELIAKRIAKP